MRFTPVVPSCLNSDLLLVEQTSPIFFLITENMFPVQGRKYGIRFLVHQFLIQQCLFTNPVLLVNVMYIVCWQFYFWKVNCNINLKAALTAKKRKNPTNSFMRFIWSSSSRRCFVTVDRQTDLCLAQWVNFHLPDSVILFLTCFIFIFFVRAVLLWLLGIKSFVALFPCKTCSWGKVLSFLKWETKWWKIIKAWQITKPF